MSKKDYKLVAEVLKRVHDSYRPQDYPEESYAQLAVRQVMTCLATELKAANPRFDKERWWLACGI